MERDLPTTRQLSSKEQYIREYRHEHRTKVALWNKQYHERKREGLCAKKRFYYASKSLRLIDAELFL